MYVFGVNHINIYMHTIAEDVFILYVNSYLRTILSFKLFFHTVKELYLNEELERTIPSLTDIKEKKKTKHLTFSCCFPFLHQTPMCSEEAPH